MTLLTKPIVTPPTTITTTVQPIVQPIVQPRTLSGGYYKTKTIPNGLIPNGYHWRPVYDYGWRLCKVNAK